MVNHSDIAKVAGVSRSKVSRALAGHPSINPGETERIRTIAGELGYRSNRLAEGVKTGKTRIIGCLLNDMSNPYNWELMSGMEEVVVESGYTTMVADWSRSRGRSLHRLLEYRVDGLVLACPPDPSVASDLKEFIAGGGPVVASFPAGGYGPVGMVVVDFELAASAMVGYLANLGHERIAFCSNYPDDPRLRGYRKGLSASGIDYDPRLVVQSSGHSDTFDGGCRIGALIPTMEVGPTAIMAYNDVMAAGIIHMLRDLGHRVPEDYSVTGFDGLDIYRPLVPSLTTITTHNREWGRKLAMSLIGMLSGYGPWTEQGHWAILKGGSTAPPPLSL